MQWMDEIKLEVRDYELDLQGIVNNSVYQNYFEHGRHKMIKKLGLDFDALHREGWDPVVIRAEIDYRMSLQSGNCFMVRSRAVPMGKLRFVFEQEIVREGDNAVCATARFTAATLYQGRPSPCEIILDALKNWHPG